MKKIWSLSQPVRSLADEIKNEIELPSVVADILVQRGIGTPQEAVDFLRPSLLDLNSPYAFVQMPKAVDRLLAAHASGDKVLVYGDYDVDGVTSTALLFKVLIDLGFKAVTYIPNRQEEGYGLNKEAVEKAFQAKVKVLITVDCGISSVEEVGLAGSLGMDVIVTDHHEPPPQLPAALAVIDPKLPAAGYPFFHLAGVGVAFKLAQALLERFNDEQKVMALEEDILDLVALGTIADIVPLVGENRILVAKGLRQMENTVHPGLRALLKECGLAEKHLNAGQIGFILAPRINAAGRMDTAKIGLELLLTENEERAAQLARRLSQENSARQQTEQEILAEAIERLEQGPIPRVIVLSAPHWHHGVIGIVASRLVERYYRPVFMISEEGGESKGSARGIKGYHVLEQIAAQKELLTKFGGHRQAAGFSLPTENIPMLRERLNTAVAQWNEESFQEIVALDRLVDLPEVTTHLLSYVEQLAPFGCGNPSPVFAGAGFPVCNMKTVGKEKEHLSLTFGPQGEKKGIAFRQGGEIEQLKGLPALDVAFSLEWNRYQGSEDVQLVLKDIQAEASWQKEESNRQPGLYQGIGWIDWRQIPPADWQGEVSVTGEENPVVIWDPAHRNEVFPAKSSGKAEPADTMEPALGVIVSWPLSTAEWRKGIGRFRTLGIRKIALAGKEEDRELLRRRCGFLTRKELEAAYLYLRDLARKSNPFFWLRHFKDLKAGLGEKEWQDALKLFEELGLIRCLSGYETLIFQWIPAVHKLDLEQALHYKAARKIFDRAQKLHLYLMNQSPEKLNLL